MNFYGQTAVFDRFVRNRHFWNSPFTDKASIFIDVSVNGSDFAKCSAAQSRSKRCFSIFCLLSRSHGPNLEPVAEHFSDFLSFCSTFETARSEFGGSGKQKRVIYPGFCLLSGPCTTILDQPVDKNQAFTPVFVYFQIRAPQFWTSR